ncbi:MAG: hypothetical protein ACFCUO_01260 [Rhodospirillales bacterium]
MTLPIIPLIDVADAGPIALLDTAADRLATIVAEARHRYGSAALRMGDRATWQWLTRNRNPYRDELATVAAHVAVPGALLLNLSYEWSCTCGIGVDPAGVGNRMLRTLDWPMNGIGRNVVVARQRASAGSFYNVTWPGFVGVLTAMAPGRFAAAINQPPMRRFSGSCWFDWLINRTGTWRKSALPPSHLLRSVFEGCASYREAKAMLAETPLCLPVFFTLSSADGAEGCVIERLENRAVVHEAPTSISNHWLGFDVPGHHRGTDSVGRRALMERLRDRVGDDFSWVRPPILNPTTRLAVVANAATAGLMVQGWENGAPGTQVFRLPGPHPVETPQTKLAPGFAAPA